MFSPISFLNQSFSGADDVIAFYSESEIDADDEPLFEEQNILFKELSIRKEYNIVFLTTPTHYDKEFIRSFVSPKGVIVDTVEPALPSDDYGVLKIFFYSVSSVAFLFVILIRITVWLGFTFDLSQERSDSGQHRKTFK